MRHKIRLAYKFALRKQDPDGGRSLAPGDASGGSGRAWGRLLRPARGRDGRMGRHANLRGGEGVNVFIQSKIISFCTGLRAAAPCSELGLLVHGSMRNLSKPIPRHREHGTTLQHAARFVLCLAPTRDELRAQCDASALCACPRMHAYVVKAGQCHTQVMQQRSRSSSAVANVYAYRSVLPSRPIYSYVRMRGVHCHHMNLPGMTR